MLDGSDVVAETKNGTTTNYIRGVSGIISSSIQGTNNTTKYYLSDGHGNVTSLTDSSGTIVKSYTYDAFGVEENPSDSDANPFRYCGEYYDSEIEQIYLRARYYDPSLGRFTQQDPAMEDGYNWYVYCENEPVNRIDVTGYEWGKIRDFANDIRFLYNGSNPQYEYGYGGVRITFKNSRTIRSGMFYYSGWVEMKHIGGPGFTTLLTAYNNNGSLEMQRADFYQAMGIQFKQYTEEYTISKTESNAWKVINSVLAGIVTGGITSKAAALIAGGVASIFDQSPDAGRYKSVSTIAYEYNPKTGKNNALLTNDIYILGYNENGQEQWILVSSTNYQLRDYATY